MYLLVDPIVLCLPENIAESEEIEDFVEHLIIWSEFIRNDQDDDQFFITANCYEALVQENRYPYRESMMALINGRDDLPYDGNTAYMACQRIIESACWPNFEDIVNLPLDQFDFDIDTVHLDPDLVERIPQEIEKSFRETFGYVAYAKEIDQNVIASNLLLLTHPRGIFKSCG